MADEWATLTLGDLGRIVTGKTPSTSVAENFGGTIPFITPSDMDGRRIIGKTARYLTETGANSVKGARIPKASVMVSCIGSDMGKAAIAAYNSVTNQQINSIIVDEKFCSEFVYYNLSTRKHEIRHEAAGGSAQPILNKSTFSKLQINLPPLPEQKAIARILGTLDDKIELNRRMNATLEAMARALFQSWFVDFDPVHAKAAGRQPSGMDAKTAALFPDSFQDSELGRISAGWRAGSIYEVADVIYGAPFSSKQFNEDENGKPLIRIRDLADESPGVYTPEVHPKGYMVQPGNVVVGMDGEFRAYLWGGVPAWLNQRVCVFAPKPTHSAAFVRNSIIVPLAHVEATETATTVIHLGKNDIDRFKVIIPSPEVHAAFAKLSQPWYDQIVANKQQSRTLATLRDTLLPKLLSGELSVAGLEREVEHV
jgi:type I restriction enzyme, S subunit